MDELGVDLEDPHEELVLAQGWSDTSLELV